MVRATGGRYVTYITVIASVYIGVLLLMYVFQRKILYRPGKSLGCPVDCGVREMVAINLNSEDGFKIVSWYKSASTNKPTLVYFQGNAGTIGDRHAKVRPFLDLGIGVLLVGYRGYANNPGAPSEAGLYSDASLALAFLTRTGISADHWILYGESLGSAVAVEMARRAASQTPVAAVILEAPMTSMIDAGRHHYPWVPTRLLLKDRFESDAKIKFIKSPLMILHGTIDPVVPLLLGKKLFNSAIEPKTACWIDGAAHNDLYEFGGDQQVIEFIQNTWKKSTT